MRSFLSIFLFLLASIGFGQLSQPTLLGTAEWKITTPNAIPDYLPAITHQWKMTKTISQDTVPRLVSRKIDPGTEILSNKAFRPKTGSIRITGIKLVPFKTETAPPLLKRDNQEFNISYTDRLHGYIANFSYGMAEDKEHNIWIATEMGLVKYDGYHYQLFNHNSGFQVNPIVNVTYDNQYRLWVATDKGLYYIQHDSLFTLESKEIDLKNISCRNVKTDRLGRIWACTWENGAICIENKDLAIYDTSCGLPNNEVFTILLDKEGKLYLVSSESGVTIIEKSRVLRMFHHSKQMQKPILLSIEEDENGIWMGSFIAGLINLNKKDTVQYSMFGKYTERIYDIKKAPGGLWLSIYGSGLYYFSQSSQFLIGEYNGLQSRSPYFLMEDSFHNIWIADYINGFSRLNENSFFLRPYENKLIKSVGKIATDKVNGQWLFTGNSGAQYRKGKTITQYSYSLPDGNIILNFPNEGIVASDGSIWMGSYGEGPVKGGTDIFTSYELFKDSYKRIVQSVKEDLHQQIWFSTSNAGLLVYDRNKFWQFTQKTGLLENEPGRLFSDLSGTIYCGYANGIQRYKGRQIETFYLNKEKFTDQINYFHSSDATTSFIGTENNGLLIIHKNKVYQLNIGNGLLSNQILTIVQSGDRKLWITTDQGTEFFVFEGINVKEHRIFTQVNGSYLANNGNVLLDASGNPFWPLSGSQQNKKVVYNPAFHQMKENAPYFSINQITVRNQRWDTTQQISILPNDKLTIDYSVKYWGRENNAEIQYLLIAKDGDSSVRSVDNKGHILISDIVPGNYSIYLSASDNGIRYLSKPLYLEVRNFWYNTWTFRIIMGCLVILSIVFYFRRKAKLQIAINQLLETRVLEQTLQLRKEKEELINSYQIIDRHNNEKGVLLQEINHRVKNNLQFMIAILDMQLRSELPEVAKSALRSTSNRMNAMSLIHEMLYENENIGDISSKKYLKELVGYFKRMASNPDNDIIFHLESEDIFMPMKPAISLGMIVSELVGNSLKHAFTNIRNPEINIKLTQSLELGKYTLHYKDNGNGFTDEVSSKKGLGNRLINIFSRELDGTYTIESYPHFEFILTFNPNKQTELDE